MEPEVRVFLTRILNTICLAILWMMTSIMPGTMFDIGVIHDSISWVNIVFYSWAVLSFCGILWYILKLWSKPIDFER